VLETAKLNSLDPEAYLANLIDRITKGHSATRLKELLPWHWSMEKSAANQAAAVIS
jgi:transposase